MTQPEFKQDLSRTQEPGGPFVVNLFFTEPVPQPSREQLLAVLGRHVGEVSCFCYDDKVMGLAAQDYVSHFKEADLPPQLMVMSCTKYDTARLGAFERSQMWDCPNREEVLADCRYTVVATDMMAFMPPGERAALTMDFLEALVELYPSCRAVYLPFSGKLHLAEAVRAQDIPREDRFIRFAVNARFFNIQGGKDMLVDTLGMGTLYLPDLQYHFHGMDPNWVVNHAYCTASYILAHENPFKSGDTVDGIVNGRFVQSIQWRCQYEKSLIQPSREVLDIYMNEYAAGQRK